VATPDGHVAQDAEEARQIAKGFGGQAIVKAQIHAGGRGQGRGVKVAKDPDTAAGLYKPVLGLTPVPQNITLWGRLEAYP